MAQDALCASLLGETPQRPTHIRSHRWVDVRRGHSGARSIPGIDTTRLRVALSNWPPCLCYMKDRSVVGGRHMATRG